MGRCGFLLGFMPGQGFVLMQEILFFAKAYLKAISVTMNNINNSPVYGSTQGNEQKGGMP